jgi:hypothetical protein
MSCPVVDAPDPVFPSPILLRAPCRFLCTSSVPCLGNQLGCRRSRQSWSACSVAMRRVKAPQPTPLTTCRHDTHTHKHTHTQTHTHTCPPSCHEEPRVLHVHLSLPPGPNLAASPLLVQMRTVPLAFPGKSTNARRRAPLLHDPRAHDSDGAHEDDGLREVGIALAGRMRAWPPVPSSASKAFQSSQLLLWPVAGCRLPGLASPPRLHHVGAQHPPAAYCRSNCIMPRRSPRCGRPGYAPLAGSRRGGYGADGGSSVDARGFAGHVGVRVVG